MCDPAADWLAGIPEQLHGPLSRCAAGLPANVALMQLVAECTAPEDAEAALSSAATRLDARGDTSGGERLRRAIELLHANPNAFHVVRSILGRLDHSGPPGSTTNQMHFWAEAFDRAARENPEGSVALYALGNPDLLDAATAEIVDRLHDWGLLSPAADCLDIGCGIGRFERALAEHVRRIVGIDISAAMTDIARQRTQELPNVEIRQAGGGDLGPFKAQSFDLVFAVDSFPYIVQSGPELTERMLGECARVLRPGGGLVILNFSYRGDLGQDRADLADFAERAGMRVLRSGTADFQLWDGASFVLHMA